MHKISEPIFKIIAEAAAELKVDAFVVGGYVRDYYLKRPCTDIDVVVVGSGIALAEKIGEKLHSKVSVFKSFGTAMLRHGEIELEFVGARKESYRSESRKPIVEDGTIEDDQDRRDFTINAMAFSLCPHNFGELVDPFDGIGDLERKIIRTPLEPDKTFSDDPLRMIRAIRFATQLDFEIQEETLESIKANGPRVSILSKERITTELNKIIMSESPSRGFLLLEQTGLLKLIFPEMDALKGVEKKNSKGHKDNFVHTLKVLDNLSENSDKLYLRWAAILHDIAKPRTKKWDARAGWTFHAHEVLGSKMVTAIFKNLRLPLNEKMKYVQKLVFLHLRPIILSEDIVTDSAVRRLLFEAGDDVDDLMTLCEADITSGNRTKVEKYLKNFALVRQKLIVIEQKDKIRNFQPPIDGDLIMKTYDIEPSNVIGEIKIIIKDAILDGKIENNYEQAYALMEELAAERGLIKKR